LRGASGEECPALAPRYSSLATPHEVRSFGL